MHMAASQGSSVHKDSRIFVHLFRTLTGMSLLHLARYPNNKTGVELGTDTYSKVVKYFAAMIIASTWAVSRQETGFPPRNFQLARQWQVSPKRW